ncbi:MAG: efflux RND transporter periplasmic adaptor subunit [Armatimonadetes bacterium]|nr:efflux RND transporter periplasmic adaptor subunit [Armatimonadota bacterium]
MKRVVVAIVLLAVALALWNGVRKSQPREGLYHGVVETRQYEMGFEVPGRIAAFTSDEGDAVKAGQELARLDERELKAAVDASAARLGTLEARLAALEEGSRPAEIGQVQARVERAAADLERLENGATREQLEEVRAEMAAARERWTLQQDYRDEDVAAARASLDAAAVTLENARKDLDRFTVLFREGAVPAKTLEQVEDRQAAALGQQRAAAENYRKLREGPRSEEREEAYQHYQARRARYEDLAAGTRPEELRAARAELEYWRNQLALVQEGPRAQDIQAARKEVAGARASLQSARLSLAKARLISPVAAHVLRRNLELGEMVSPGVPVLTLADLGQPWVEIFVPETELGNLRLGDRFEATVDSLPDRTFPGTVTRIYEKAEFTPKSIQTERERVNLVFRVKVSLENPALELKPGMPADARRVGS